MKITVIGFGSWGIPLGCLLDKNGHDVIAWDNEAYVAELIKTRTNRFLPDAVIPPSIKITADVGEASDGAEMFLIALASRAITETDKFDFGGKIVVSASKGLEETRQIRISEYLRERNKTARIAVLTGPTHAEEVLRAIPTAIVAASEDEGVAEIVQNTFSTDDFRVYTSTDVIGAEIGGALKNVIALAAGCSDGLGFGDNTKAALITRGIAEITRLGVAMGGREQTFAGLSGIGDLIVTCTSRHSRNWRAGELLAKGKPTHIVLEEIGAAVEGIATAKTALTLARKFNVEMPIVEEITKILFENKNPAHAVADLMRRGLKGE
ncbi:MAG: NAD(P)-dependent glycerol-3-phosphate dehydrogenase [Defluviitaleaceae bacterium]|nr:NAD(P)-dependent glycerol-3-phosphate dehydrogenase [Defluviitaleaceae bacterium]